MPRFQADESVQKTISNTMRYSTGRAEKEQYQSELGKEEDSIMKLGWCPAEQVRNKRGREAEIRSAERELELEQVRKCNEVSIENNNRRCIADN